MVRWCNRLAGVRIETADDRRESSSTWCHGTSMGPRDSTCWTLLRGAAAGGEEPRAEFAARYAPVVRTYLASRWRNTNLLQDLDDAVQDVFVECLSEGGLLERVRADHPGGFRAFLYGAVRNVALRAEEQRARRLARRPSVDVDLAEVPGDEVTLSRVFDRAWARAIL